MNRIIALILAMVMAFGLVACGSESVEPTTPSEPTAPAEITTPNEPTATEEPTEAPTDNVNLELPKPMLAPRELQSVEGKNSTVFTASKYWKFYDGFYLNSDPLYKDIHFYCFDYSGWKEDHTEDSPDAAYNAEQSWTLSVTGDELVQVDIYGYDYTEKDLDVSAYLRVTWLARIDADDLETTPGEVFLQARVNDDFVTLIVATMCDATTGEYYYEYFGRADIGA